MIPRQVLIHTHAHPHTRTHLHTQNKNQTRPAHAPHRSEVQRVSREQRVGQVAGGRGAGVARAGSTHARTYVYMCMCTQHAHNMRTACTQHHNMYVSLLGSIPPHTCFLFCCLSLKTIKVSSLIFAPCQPSHVPVTVTTPSCDLRYITMPPPRRYIRQAHRHGARGDGEVHGGEEERQ